MIGWRKKTGLFDQPEKTVLDQVQLGACVITLISSM